MLTSVSTTGLSLDRLEDSQYAIGMEIKKRIAVVMAASLKVNIMGPHSTICSRSLSRWF